MEYKTFPSKVVAVDGDERTVAGITAVMGVVDYGYDRIYKGAFVKTITERANQIKHLWQHDFDNPPIATVVDLKEVGRGELPPELKEKFPDAKGGLLIKRKYLDTPRGNEVLTGLKSDPPAITEMSFGYDPVKYDFEEVEDGDLKGALIRNLREVRLWDTSDVNWGMNPATMAVVKSVQFKDTGKAPEAKEWKTPTLDDFTDEEFSELSDAELARLSEHFAWKQSEKPSAFSNLVFPHHEPTKTGVGPAVWKGVEEAMRSLMFAPGIPLQDRKAVYMHLAKHYEQFGKEPPDFKMFSLLWAVNESLEYLTPTTEKTAVQGFSFAPDTVCQQLQRLDALLRAEPKSAQALLTQKQFALKLEIRRRQLAQLSNP